MNQFQTKDGEPLSLRDPMFLGLQGLRRYLQWITVKIRRKVDVVLFQDCWMSTLETAYELQDVVRYVVGSQSLVPIEMIWNYGKLFTDLANQDFAGLVRDIGKQYDQFVTTFSREMSVPGRAVHADGLRGVERRGDGRRDAKARRLRGCVVRPPA